MSFIQKMNTEYSLLIDPTTYTGKIVEKEGIPGLLRYLNNEQYYAIATVPTNWGIIPKTSPLYGRVGFHALIRLPGQRQCEWQTNPTPWDAHCSQIEIRSALGKTIEKMYHTHKAMHPVYHKVGDIISGEGYLGYRPFKNDCHTYINLILNACDQPKSALKRI